MPQVHSFNLQVAEHRHDATEFNAFDWLQDIEQARHVLLDIDGHLQRLEGGIFNLPQISHHGVGDLFKFVDIFQEVVHALHSFFKDLVLRFLWK